MFRRLLLALVLLLALALAGTPATQLAAPVHAAPAAAPSAQHQAFFDKTRVVVHLAIAYGVFHHWVWKPFRAGDLNMHHKIQLIKAGLALLFAVHEIHKALDITSHSNSNTLKKLNSVLVGLETKFTSVGTLFHQAPNGLTDTQVSSSINQLNSGVDSSNSILHAPDAPISQLGNF
jgi:hypothetical protein